MVASTEGEQQRKQVLKLIEEKDSIERKIAEFGLVLQQNNVGFSEPLVDAGGYPRNDIDVRSVRLARNQINCLQNDLKSITRAIDDGLQKYFAYKKEEGVEPSAALASKLPPQMRQLRIEENLRPFLVVNLVSENSPGSIAGVQLNDLILKFGSINSTNFTGLQQIGELVKNCQNQQVKITIRRNGSEVELILVPRSWPGQGLLGFKVAEIPH